MGTLRKALLLALAVVVPAGLVGCVQPFSMGIFTPIPVPPWVTERMEEKYCYKNDYRTAILQPIREGFPPPLCEDPPDDSMVLRAMPHVKRGFPYVCEEFRDDVQIVNERMVDRIDPPRFYPLIGPAQLHHCHWKSTIYYTETIESGYPFPFRCRKPRVEVVYIDKDHLHLYVCDNPEAARSMARDITGF
jgi:hypothetical protein